MKKYQFYFIATAFVCDCVLFLMSFITVFMSYLPTVECWCDTDTTVLAVFSMLFLAAGYIMAPIVRECYDEAFGK